MPIHGNQKPIYSQTLDLLEITRVPNPSSHFSKHSKVKQGSSHSLNDFGPCLTNAFQRSTDDKDRLDRRYYTILVLKRTLREKEEKLVQSFYLVNFIAEQLNKIYLSLSQAERIFDLQKNTSLANGTQLSLLLFKPIRSIIDISIHIFKLYHYRHVQQELVELEKKYAVMLENFGSQGVLDCFAEFNYKIKEEREKSKEEIKIAFRQIGSVCAKITSSIEKIKTIIQSSAYSNQIEMAACILKNSMSFWKDYDKWQKARKFYLILESWKQALKQSGGSGYANVEPKMEPAHEELFDLGALPFKRETMSREAIFEHHRQNARALIEDLVLCSREQSFDVTVKKFAEYHIDLTKLKNVPNSQEDWLRQVGCPDFIDKLCKIRAKYTDAHEIMIDKASRCVSLKKLEHEQSLISFQQYEFLLGMTIHLAEICLCLPYIGSKWTMQFIAKHILSSLPLVNTSALKMINSDLSPSRIGILIAITSYLYNRARRPNAYSREAYLLQLKKDLSKYISLAHSCLHQIQTGVLIFKIQWIEKNILRLHHHELAADTRYVNWMSKIEQASLDRDLYLLNLKERLKELDLKDAELLLNHRNPKFENENESEVIKEYRYQYSEKHKNDRTVEILGEALRESSQIASKPFLQAIKERMGIDLQQYQEKQIPSLVSEFYSQRGSVLAKSRQKVTGIGS